LLQNKIYMLSKNELLDVVHQQKIKLNDDNSYPRKLLKDLTHLDREFVHIISGIRRCGKSTLMAQLIRLQAEPSLYLNFDTPRLFGFEFSDFRVIDEILREQSEVKWLFFDELQIVESWEIFVRGKLDEGYGVVITGSNASLLSRELGTKLTGRHINKELFPFSFQEFCGYKHLEKGKESLKNYLNTGGFPQYIKTKNKEILNQLVMDIVYRDIAVRYNIRDEQSLKRLFIFLVSNIGNLVTATKLKQVMNIKSTATLLDYFSFYEETYLLHLLPKYSYSIKAQMINPKKIYLIDTGLQYVLSSFFSDNTGKRLENMVYLELCRYTKELFYFSENNKECDFVVCENGKVKAVVQVCCQLNNENSKREIDGLLEAINFLQINQGFILTLNQTDTIYDRDKIINVVPVYDFDFEKLF
jgi:predicted AAA+ superfamily ATPase